MHYYNALNGHSAVGYSQIVRDFAGILHTEDGQVYAIANLEGVGVVERLNLIPGAGRCCGKLCGRVISICERTLDFDGLLITRAEIVSAKGCFRPGP